MILQSENPILQSEIALLRALKKTAVILLLMFRLDKPMGRNEIAEILDIDPRTVRNHLNSLLHFGLITRTHYQNGYSLSQFGRQMILGQITQDLAHLPVALKDPPEALPEQIQVLTEAHEAHEPAQALPTDDHTAPKIKKGTICVPAQIVFKEVKEEEESINLKYLTSSSDSLSKNRDFTMQKLLSASSLLFGEPGVITDQLPECPSRIVLGWLAHAYQQRHRLRSPAGLVYCQLKKGKLPDENYLEHPETYLPFDYLLAVGYRQHVEMDQETAKPEDPGPEEMVIEDPSLSIPIHGNITARRAWEIVLEQLRMEMPKAAFDTWLVGTRVIKWSGDCMSIGATNAYARDWLDGRLTSKVEKLLNGILCQRSRVRFMIE